MEWKTKSGIRITGKPKTKSYYLLLRDRKGFEKKIKTTGFVNDYFIPDYVPNHMWGGSTAGEVTPQIPNSNKLRFVFKEWMNNSVALYNEY